MPVTASPLTAADNTAKRRATASAVLQAAERVPGEAAYIPFSWSVEHIVAEAPNRRFVLHLVPKEDCRGFLFRAPLGGQAELLCEWEGRAETALRLPQAGELVWDGRDDSMLVIVAAGQPFPDKAAEADEAAVRRQASPLRGGERFHSSTGPLTLDLEALGLGGGDPAQRP